MCLSQVTIRDIKDSDYAFVCDAYWRSQKKIDGKSMSDIKTIVSSSKVKIACLRDDENVIISFAVFKDNELIWGYTKTAFRKMGFFKYMRDHND